MVNRPTSHAARRYRVSVLVTAGTLGCLAAASVATGRAAGREGPLLLTGSAAVSGDWSIDAPGVRRKLTVGDLPAPYATTSVDNGPKLVPRPEGAWPKAPGGFKVELFAENLRNPRRAITASNGDVLIAESEANRIHLLRPGADGKLASEQVFTGEGLELPFGLAFYPAGKNPRYLYVGNTGSVVRFPYHKGDLHATGPAETIVANIPNGGRLRGGGHWTRDLAFSRDGKKLWVSVGSASNVSDNAAENRRADILEFNPDGTGERIYASGIRNAVGIALHPSSGELWASVNERDELGDDLVPDYITHVQDSGFYGWPWFYIGGHQDPRHHNAHPELKDRVLAPDVLLQSHSASLQLAFYTGRQFPKQYRGDIFAAEHGSWNRARRTGYKVIRVPLRKNRATGEYADFLTGFVTPEGNVWGRPVGVTVGADGSLFVTDDGAGVVWRVSYQG